MDRSLRCGPTRRYQRNGNRETRKTQDGMRQIAYLLLAPISLRRASEHCRDPSALRRDLARVHAIGAADARRAGLNASPPTTGTMARMLSLVGDNSGQDRRSRPSRSPRSPWRGRSDSTARHWQFTLRRGVKFHDGSAASPAAIAQILGALHPDWNVRVIGATR